MISWYKAKVKSPYSAGDMLRNWNRIISERPLRKSISPRWIAPPAGWFKLNFDGSSFGNPRPAGIGRVLRNELGDEIMSFSIPIGVSDANSAEARALLFGLKWYAANNMGPLIVEGDSSNALAWAANRSSGP
ncbi:uncharacterized protein LOC143888881 [Tasmannia lanceolata]|uniref:uncharacterized protein LOC143888881 n=1 Tax=Tasmannia lanceolata TaxID=3420 RepID=UPI00406346D6